MYDDVRQLVERFVPGCEQEAGDRRMMLHYLDLFDDVMDRTNETVHFTASGWVTDHTRGRVLMAYHNIYDSWSWTGGHADGDTNLLGVAVREAMEETGIRSVRPVSENVFSMEILTVNAHFKRGKYVVPHLHLNLTYLLEADPNEELFVKRDENSAVRWFEADEAVDACSEPDMRVIYRKLNDRMRSFAEKNGGTE